MWLDVALRMDRKDIFLNKIGRHAQNMITILGLLVNTIVEEGGGRLLDHLMSTRIFSLIMNKIFI